MMRNTVKLLLFIVFLILIFITFVYFFYKPYSYEKEYQINEYNIIENFNKNTNIYKFVVKKDELKLPFVINNKYIKKRKLITDIVTYKSEDEECIVLKSDYLNIYPLCTNNKEIYSLNIANNHDIDDNSITTIKTYNEEYNNINISNLDNSNYLLYNYKGFYLINNNSRQNIKLFNDDIYRIDLVYQKDNYLIVPNYKDNHFFNSLYLIDFYTGKLKEIESNYDISYDGYFLGDFKNSIYYVDKKDKKEYRIDIKKGIIENTDFVNIINKKLINCEYEELKITELINDFNYILDNNILYLNIDDIKIKISNNNVDKIIKIDDNVVYYLSDDTLYLNDLFKEVPLITNFEWNFNKTNMIYLYK